MFDSDKHDARLTIIESRGRSHDNEHYWHTDVTYQEAPSMGSILAAKKIPESGGDTLFASMYAANDALSSPIRKMLEELTAQHYAAHDYGAAHRVMNRVTLVGDRPYFRKE